MNRRKGSRILKRIKTGERPVWSVDWGRVIEVEKLKCWTFYPSTYSELSIYNIINVFYFVQFINYLIKSVRP